MHQRFTSLLLLGTLALSTQAQNTFPASGNVGIGTTAPQQRLHVEAPTLLSIFVNTNAPSAISGSGMIGYVKGLPTAAGQRLGYFLLGSRGGANNNYHAAGMVGYAQGAWTSTSYPAYLAFETTPSGASTRAERVRIDKDGNVGIGTNTPNARLRVVGDTLPVNAISAITSFTGNSDVRGVTAFSKPADGWGYGVEGIGGFIGGYFSSTSGTYTGTGFGVYGSASGTAGTRIGVYGTASGGTVNNWGGYFPTKTYTNELRVGGTKGATGYVAAINGKLIATEVRVELLANWPDYVFDKGYKLMPLEDLESQINTDKHLPGVPSASDMKENGIMLGAMQTKTIEKVEENTLYIIQLNNRIKELEKKIDELTKKVK